MATTNSNQQPTELRFALRRRDGSLTPGRFTAAEAAAAIRLDPWLTDPLGEYAVVEVDEAASGCRVCGWEDYSPICPSCKLDAEAADERLRRYAR